MFPDGLIWDKETGKPRTTRENEALMAIRLINKQIQDNPEQEKAGKSFDFPALVDQTLRISNLSFIEGLLQIQTVVDGLDRYR